MDQADASLPAAQFAYQSIRDALRNGRYVPGQRLSEVDLTAELGLSRGPIREAMNRLAGDGVIRIEPRRGYVVPRLDRRDIEEIYEALEALTGVSARRAAQNIDVAENRSRLKEARRALGEVLPNDVLGFARMIEEFNSVIVATAGNRRIARMIEQLRMTVHRLHITTFVNPNEITPTIARYVAIAEAILAGEQELAERLMRETVHRVPELLVEHDTSHQFSR